MPLALADTCEEPKLTGREGYSTVDCLSEEGLSMVTKPGNKKAPYLYGFVNRQGKVVVPLKYYVARDFSEGLAAVCKTVGKSDQLLCGYINASGKEVIPLKFEDLPGDFAQGLAPAKQKGALLTKMAKLPSHFNMIKPIHSAKDWLRLSLLIQINMAISIQKVRWLFHQNMKMPFILMKD